MRMVTLVGAALVLVLAARPGQAQPTATTQAQAGTGSAVAAATADAQTAPEPATLVYGNRAIVQFRGTLLLRTPSERAAAATHFIDRVVESARSARVSTQPVGDAIAVRLGDPAVFMILPADVNTLAGETLEGTATAAANALQTAFDEAVELRSPGRLLRAGLLAIGATLLYVALLWVLRWTHRAGLRRVNQTTERQLERLTGGGDILRASRVPEIIQRTVAVISMLLALVVTYAWSTFVLRRFPYTRPWGESLRTALLSTGATLARHFVDALPNLLTVLLIILATRFVVRLSNYLFDAVEQERITVARLYPEVAQPTRRIVAALLWLFAIVMAYPYMPGASSDAFKGVSVFVGLIISLGSSGIMNQVMSGLTITYSRAVRVGDFVKIGDVEGTVEQLGTLSVKIKTARREAVTIPNALVVSTPTTDYSRDVDVLVGTSVTIGYDTPWRQVEALLTLAADRTTQVRTQPPPVVRKMALLDFYVQYTLLVCLEHADQRVATLDALHANILDVFNEYGVQITSPNYEADPGDAKVVPPERWYAAPAVLPGKPSRTIDRETV